MNAQKKINGSLALGSAPRVVTIPADSGDRKRRLRVAAYARVSSSSEDQLNSFAAQNAYYTDLITSNPDWDFVDVYADKGVTGTSAEKRDDFQRLLADCRRGRIDRILTKSSSRFARNTLESLKAVRELKALNIGVVFEEQGIDTSELSGELLTTIFAMLAQQESESISEHMRRSYQMRMQMGTFNPSTVSFGYKKADDNSILIDEPRAKYVRQIFQDYLSGMNTGEIADKLRKQQHTVPALNAYSWTYHAVARILQNEKYTGNSLWQKRFKTRALPRKEVKNRGELPQYYAEETHPAIIEKALFDQVQLLLSNRKERFYTEEKELFGLRGKIRCGVCGGEFRKYQCRGITYRACRGHSESPSLCPVQRIPDSEIHSAFLRLYYKLRHQGRTVLAQLLDDLRTARRGRLLWNLSIVEINNKIANITRQDRLLAQLKQQGSVDPDIFISRRDALASQLRALKLEKERLLEAEDDQSIQQTQALLDILDAGSEILDSFDGELFDDLVDKIIVESNERLRFRLTNGLELTEKIERTVR